MKKLLRSKLIFTLVAVVLLAGAVAVPLASSIRHSHAAASATPTIPNMKLPWDKSLTNIPLTGGPHSGKDVGVSCALEQISRMSGVDFGLSSGTNVLAVAAGTVFLAQKVSDSRGPYIVGIDHGGNFATEYWHLSWIDPSIKVGVSVTQGTILAKSGAPPGGPAHLHLEFRTGSPGYLTPLSAHGMPIDGYKIWTFIDQSSGQGLNYEGTMTRGAITNQTIQDTDCQDRKVQIWLTASDPSSTIYAKVNGTGGYLTSTNSSSSQSTRLFVSGWFNQTTSALQTSNGAVLWQTHGGSHSDEAEVFANGVVYVGSDDHFVYALRASDGSQLWSYQTGGIINSPPAVSNGVVYVGSWDGYLYALRASDGSLVWKYLTGGQVHSSPAIQKGVVYFGSGDGSVYALRTSNGSLFWSYRTGGGVYAPPAIANGLVYIGSGDGNLYALQTSNGSAAWSYQTSSALYSGATLNESATVVYVSAGRFLDELGATTGKLLFSFQVGQQGGAQPAVVNGIIYICSVDSNVYSYRAADGSLIWSFMTAGFMGAKPVLVDDVLYAGGSSGLYALQAHSGAFLWEFNGPVTAPVIETS